MDAAGDRPRVVIVGGGFGGLAAAKALAHVPVEVTLLDRQNHHLFQPLLYQVASAVLNPSDIAKPIRHILAKQENCRPVLADVTGIDIDARSITTAAGTFDYDILILATGATHAYFGRDDWAEHAPGLKTIGDALDIRRRILLAFERADQATTNAERERLMTFVVVGAGPTGVELAGAIREIATRTLRKDFRRIDTTTSQVILVEAGPDVLPPFPDSLRFSASKQLIDLGVDVRTSTRVTDISADGVTTSEGFIPAGTTIWAAGVAASPLAAAVSPDTDRSGRAAVGRDLSLSGHSEVFIIGDMAAVTNADGSPVPGVASAAEQGGKHVGRCIQADLAGTPRPVFVYREKGAMATIGRTKAVADLGPRFRFGGHVAWLLWCLVHVILLVGFRSRVRALGSWTWQYFTGHRGALLITGNVREQGTSQRLD